MREPVVRVSLYASSAIAPERITELRDAIGNADLAVDDDVGAYLEESADGASEVIWFVIGLFVAGVVKPTAEATGKMLLQGLARLNQVLKERGHDDEFNGVEIISVDGKTVARYWIPRGAERERAIDAILDHFGPEPEGDKDRRWYPGRGWATDDEMRQTMGDRELD
jgi:hypothetical protein